MMFPSLQSCFTHTSVEPQYIQNCKFTPGGPLIILDFNCVRNSKFEPKKCD